MWCQVNWAMLLSVMALAGCSNGPSLRTVVVDEAVPEMKITPSEALELARPHLDGAFDQIIERREPSEDSGRLPYTREGEPITRIMIQGEWYHISQTNIISKNLQSYLYGAVRVHGQTGEVVPPEFEDRKKKSLLR